jgi:leucyl aminopeptidase
MNITQKKITEAEVKADVLIIPLFEDSPPGIYSGFGTAVNNCISGPVKTKDFTGRHGQTMLLPCCNIGSPRILLTGLGKLKEISAEKLRRAGARAFAALMDIDAPAAALSSRTLNCLHASGFEMSPAFYFLEGALLGSYCFEKYKSEDKKEKKRKAIKSVAVLCNDGKLEISWLKTLISATFFARDMISAPSNDMTPTAISKLALRLAKGKLKVRVLEKRNIEKEKMGAYLSVAKGSNEPPKFIIAEYSGSKERPIILIGKTITFDSGGLDIKPGDGMEKMKYDMAGGAVALAVIHAVAELKMPVNLIAILPAAENLLGGSASRPGDVVRTIQGKTVEIISTDAEGRLTIADAIGYARKHYNPEVIIDIATLTGACNMAFGNEAIALMGTSAEFGERLKAASEEAYERVWPMPLFDEFADYLKSDIADIRNVGSRKAALCSSAYFLKEFAGETPWIHLDIAGAAWNDNDRPYCPKGASGIGVRLLLNLLKKYKH